MIRLVAFDLDDTLYNATWLVNKSRIGGLKLIQEKGLELKDFDKAIEVLNEVVEEFGSNYSKHFDIFLHRIQDRHDIVNDSDFSISKYIATGVMGYHKVKVRYLKAYRDVKTSLQKLKDMKVLLAIFSDGIAVKQYEKLLRMNIEQYFDFIFISDEIGINKPNLEFFKQCIEKIGIEPSEILYIGDRLDKDIAPANNVGLYTALIHRGKYDPNIHDIVYLSRPDFEIHSLSELFKIISQINKKNIIDKSKMHILT